VSGTRIIDAPIVPKVMKKPSKLLIDTMWMIKVHDRAYMLSQEFLISKDWVAF